MEGNGSNNASNGSQGEDRVSGRPAGGGSLEKLTREELITKCRNLLALAQKAKSAKDDTVAELKKMKLAVKNTEAAEETVRKVEAEASSLREMVANLTEGKVALITKIESLQRQLKVSSSEVDSLQAIEEELIKERNHLEVANIQLIEENRMNLEKLQEFQPSSTQKLELLEKAWKKEKTTLEERVENLEAQLSQVDILKAKCKKLFQEKSAVEEELSRQQKLVAKGIKIQGELTALKEEKKASEIILESTKKVKNAVEAKLQSLESQVSNLKQLKEEGDNKLRLELDKTQGLENRLRECNTTVMDSECNFRAFQERISEAEQEKQFHEDVASKVRKQCEALELEVKALREELSVETEKNKYLEQQMEGWEAQKAKESAICGNDIEELRAKLLKMEEIKDKKDSELQKLIEERASTERSLNDEVENLKLQEDHLIQEKKQIECKLEQSHEDQNNLMAQLEAVEEKLKESDICSRDLLEKLRNTEREKNELTVKIKEKESENEKLFEQLRQRDSEDVDFVENKNRLEELNAQIGKQNLEVQQLLEEKVKLLSKYEDFEKEVFYLRENLKVVQKEKEELDIEFSKSVVELEENRTVLAGEKDKTDHLKRIIEDLTSNNTELTSRVEQLQRETENIKSILDPVQNTGIDITSLCKKIYPMLSKTLLPNSLKKDVLESVKRIQKLLAEANTRKESFKCEEDVQCLIGALSQLQEQSRNLTEAKDNRNWDSFSLSFDAITKSFITFYIHAIEVLDVEENTYLGEICRESSSLFAILCRKQKNDEIRLDQVTSMLEDLKTEKSRLENKFVEVVKESEIISKRLENSSNHTDIIIKEKDGQLENLKKLISEYENSQIKLNQTFEKEKLEIESNLVESKERISELEEKLHFVENRKVELENQISSGNIQREEVLNNLRQQVNTVMEENEAMAHKCRESSAANVDLEKTIKKQVEDLQKHHSEWEALVSEKIILQKEIENLRNMTEDIEKQKNANENIWMDQKQDLEKKLSKALEEKHSYEMELGSITSKVKSVEENLVKEKELLREKLTSVIKEQEVQMKETVNLKAENVLLHEKIQELQVKIEELNGQVQHLQSVKKITEEEIQTSRNEKEALEKRLKEAENHRLQLSLSIESSAGRCEELLAELNEMNKVLRERGERISRLEVANKEKSEELENTSSELKELQRMMSSREAELANKQEQLQTITEQLQSINSDSSSTVPAIDNQHVKKLEEKVNELEQERATLKKTIQVLENELSSIRENPSPVLDGQSEIMSTSTISRAEDTQRMKELEDTFEERYMKLKSVAIKLKKRVAELTAQQNSLEETRNKLATEKDVGPKDSMRTVSKNVQALQGEIDRLQDKVDSKAKELKEQGKQLTAAAEQLANVKSQLAASQDENESLLRAVKNLEATIASQEVAAGSLRGQVASLDQRLTAELEKQQSLENRRKKAEERMEEERQRSVQCVKELEEAKQDAKTRSLLDLEMRDYELTVQELNDQLAEKDYCISELQAEMEREKGRSGSLQDQLTHLTTQEATERERAEKMKRLLLEHKTQLAELRLTKEAQSTAKEMDRVTIEQLTQEVEKQKLIIAEVTSEKTKLENLVRQTKLYSERQIEVLEEQHLKYKAEVQQLMAELTAVQNEFEGYKVRAASVLRQKNRPPEASLNELQSEKYQLQADFEAAQLKVQQLQSELSAIQAEHSFLQSEKDGIVRQLSSLSEELSKREISHHEKITCLESKMETKIAEYQMIITSMSNQNETMSNNFKKQLETLRETHAREMKDLTARLEQTENKLWQLKNTLNSSASLTSSSIVTSMPSTTSTSHPLRSESDHSLPMVSHNNTHQHRRQPSHGYDEPRIDVTNMVREEGEGSEWVEPVHHSPGKLRGYSPPPLDQLINSPLPSAVGLTSQDDNVSITSINTDATGKEVARLESKLSAGEMRIQQLTSLLHESEAENAKLTQLADALKEEIRRSARNENREKHMENMEYMKNVILKFLVLRSGEERKHLVPVLKTVLQLSPAETLQLEHLACGEEDGGSSVGWGNYLHLWSSR